MHLHVNFITLAENAEEAKSNVESWIGEHSNGEYFDYGGLEDPEEVVLLNEIREKLKVAKDETQKLLPVIDADIERYKKSGSRFLEGCNYMRYGRILLEYPSDDMPFFNIENYDWSLPTEVPNDYEGCDWYAVMVDLHF